MSVKGDVHTFWCIQCGQAGIPCFRPVSHQRGKFHRKKLYCPHCKIMINHIECRNDVEVAEFKEAYDNGEFFNEIEESIKESTEIEF